MTFNPQQLAIRRRELATDYNNNMKELAVLKKKKAIKIIELLGEHKTNAKAEVYYNATEDGQRMLELEYLSKGLLELMRACKTEIEIMNGERFGEY